MASGRARRPRRGVTRGSAPASGRRPDRARPRPSSLVPRPSRAPASGRRPDRARPRPSSLAPLVRRPLVAGRTGHALVGRDLDEVLDVGDPRRRPGHALGHQAFRPRRQGAVQRHPAFVRLHANRRRIELGVTTERRLDQRLDLGDRGPGPHDDLVQHAAHPAQVADHRLGDHPLGMPVDIPLQGDPALDHRDLDATFRHARPAREGIGRHSGDVGVGGHALAVGPDLEAVGDRPHAVDALGDPLGGDLIAEGRHGPGERHDPVMDRDADLPRMDTLFPEECVINVAPKLCIGIHGCLSPTVVLEGMSLSMW